MTLTEYELADLAMSWQATASPTTALFLTIMSGYLIVAWLVGDKLTRAQATLVNVLFFFFQSSLVIGWCFRWGQAYKITTVLSEMDPDFYPVSNPAPLILFAAVMAISIPACIKFMWDVRHPKD